MSPSEMAKRIKDFFANTKFDKRRWHDYCNRRDALPRDYRLVMTGIQNYLFNTAMDGTVMEVMDAILALLEEGVADGRPVLDVTGDDVADFACNVMMAVQAKTWTGLQGVKLNERIHKQLKEMDK